MKSSDAYEIINKLEQIVRKTIEDELNKISSNWWNEAIPEDIKKKTESRKQNSEHNGFPRGQEYPIISYVDFSDYEKIITFEQNWKSIFKLIFRDDVSIAGKFRDLRPIRNDISHSRDLSKKDGERLQFIAQEIKGAIEYFYKNKIYEKQTTNSEFEEFNEHVITLSVSSDRTVYPENAFVHSRVNLQDVLANEPIIFQIYNTKNGLCAEKQLDPQAYDNKELKSAGIYQVSFDPSEFEGSVGDILYVKAKHGRAVATDSWTIDEREVVIQTDKSVYMMNTDMIVTVIDPDADKNSQLVEFVGNSKDSELIIESKFGKIKGYKLLETGESTGIFQGIIGVMGIRKDGTMIEREIDGKVINKIQGTGIEDGFIGGTPGDEIKLTYKSKSGTASVEIFIANFGATVELDQKIYKPTDKVYITIIAPDLNLNSEMVDEIGNNLESNIQIRTSNDEIKNYKLVETGTDTGIFTGEIQLSKNFERDTKMLEKLGPINGKINCVDDDFLEISFTFFEVTVVGRAIIKS